MFSVKSHLTSSILRRISLALVAACGMSAAAIGHAVMAGVDERPLNTAQLNVLFGGGNGLCCVVDDTCKSLIGGCSAFNGDEAGCTVGNKPYFNNQYAKHCGTRPGGNPPEADCTQYLTDLNGVRPNCLDWWSCQYNRQTGFCTKSAFVIGTPGTFSCASNCP